MLAVASLWSDFGLWIHEMLMAVGLNSHDQKTSNSSIELETSSRVASCLTVLG